MFGTILSFLMSLVSTPEGAFTLTGQYDTPGWSRDVFVRDNYAYVADYDMGLRIIDVSNPSNPQEIGFCSTPGYAFGVFVKDNYAYISCDVYDYFCIVDISNPSNPVITSYTQIFGSGYNVFVSGNYAYLAVGDYLGGLYIYNVSNPYEPAMTGYYWTYSSIGVYVVDNIALLAAGYLFTIDVTNPNNPVPLDSYYDNYNEYAYDVCCEGNYAYCTFDYGNKTSEENDALFYSKLPKSNNSECLVSNGGLRIIDIADPANIQLAGYVNTSMDAFGVSVNDGYAFTTGWINGGIQAVNVINPLNPFLAGSYNTQGEARDVFCYDNYIFLADGQSGLKIFQYSALGVEEQPDNNVHNNSLTITQNQNREVTFNYFLEGPAQIELKIIDVSGRIVFESSAGFHGGNQQFTFRAEKAGTYFLIFKNSENILNKSFIVL
ncbi:T9SS type A sorting domain-containing protein [candidate division WOR-3 bacterium]|nr:T9SS type A sorting domain-containing protein [candidate division WOR-3 bacterium]